MKSDVTGDVTSDVTAISISNSGAVVWLRFSSVNRMLFDLLHIRFNRLAESISTVIECSLRLAELFDGRRRADGGDVILAAFLRLRVGPVHLVAGEELQILLAFVHF